MTATTGIFTGELQHDGDLVFAARDCWYMFHTFMLDGQIYLEIYRSIQLPEHDEWLAPARELLNQHEHVEVSRETVTDHNMVFRTAERVIYRLTDVAGLCD